MRTLGLFPVVVVVTVLDGTAVAATLPNAVVSNVTTTSPVLRSTPNIAVSATVTPAFDANSGPTTVVTGCSACNPGNNFCGYGSNAVKSQQVLTTTTTSVGNPMTTVTAAPEFGSANPTIARLNGGVLSGSGTFTGILPTTAVGVDGVRSVTVTAYVSEEVTTAVTVTTNRMSASSCSGTVVTSNAVPQPPVTVVKYGTGSANGSYILDINAPAMDTRPVAAQPRVQQGGDKFVHNVLTDGSASTKYTTTNVITGPGGYTSTAQGVGTFGPATPSGTGHAGLENSTVGVHVACDAPTGTYTVLSAANTVDAGLNPFEPVVSSTVTSFDVDPGLLLQDQTLVVSEVSATGGYGALSCFSGTLANRNLNTLPGSFHITATVNTLGRCASLSNVKNPKIVLTLPAGFSFATSGNSPAAHVFLGESDPGFDLHYPDTMKEVTGLLAKPDLAPSGQMVTVDLSKLDLSKAGLGPTPSLGAGIIPASYTIYVRARATFTNLNNNNVVPADNTAYIFNTKVTAGLPGIGEVSSESSQTVTVLQACLNGNPPTP
jgi:hypothetical protein